MNLLRYPGLDLPIYEEDKVAFTTSDIREVVQSGVDTVVRRACLRYEGPQRDLRTILALGDRVLTKVCEVMHADMANHTWGLAPLSEANRTRLRARADPETYDSAITSYGGNLDNSLIPRGYGLVTAVDVIIGAERLDYFQREDVASLRPCYIGVKDGGYCVTNGDLRDDQFVSNPIGMQRGENGIVLVDPEPRLCLTPVSMN